MFLDCSSSAKEGYIIWYSVFLFLKKSPRPSVRSGGRISNFVAGKPISDANGIPPSCPPVLPPVRPPSIPKRCALLVSGANSKFTFYKLFPGNIHARPGIGNWTGYIATFFGFSLPRPQFLAIAQKKKYVSRRNKVHLSNYWVEYSFGLWTIL